MHEFSDSLNLIGIAFEITGFLFLLPRFKELLYNRIKKVSEKNEKFYKKYRHNNDAFPTRETFYEKVTNIEYRKIETNGIVIVMIGLFMQGISTLYHS